MSEPKVSVVTPFYNTAAYLAECIESVLAQTHQNFEYLLVDNLSTDGSRAIADRYAAQDRRIRVIQNPAFVGQVENYNGALTHVAADSRYVKIVQADDALFPECLQRMVHVAEQEPSVGLVSSYYLKGREVGGEGLPYGTRRVSGRDACRLMLLEKRFFLGSPTTVMYRADLVRSRKPFYALGRYHEDTEAGYEILLEHDLGFVQQVLSFNRVREGSVMGTIQDYNDDALDYLIVVERYAAAVLDAKELAAARADARRYYYGCLARALLRRRGRAYWDHHRRGLASLGRKLRWRDVLPRCLGELARTASNPGEAVARALRSRRG